MNDALCGCCEGTQQLTPASVANRPGLAALAYRVGTHAAFLETMKARLASVAVDDPSRAPGTASDPVHPLRGLTTRAADDAALALLDGWATVADVLTFYQERIANEGYLRTAAERRSVLELARLVGYALRPGVASTVYLAYTIDENQRTPVEIPAGARSQSVPGPGELPQSFETSDALDARAGWNTLKPRLSRPQTLAAIQAGRTLYLQGVATNLKPNDPLLIVEGATQEIVRVADVQIDTQNDRTALVLVEVQNASRAVRGAAYAQQVRAVAERYRNPADFNVNAAGNMAQEVIGILDSLHASATDTTPMAGLIDLVSNTHLAQIRQALAEASKSGFSRLQAWLSALAVDLEGVTAAKGTSSAMAGNRSVVASRRSHVNETGDALHDVIMGLSIPPSVPPANALQLTRDAVRSFGLDADGGLQVVNAVRPDLKGALPTALSNVQVTESNPLEVYALRLKTGVYGNTAPLKPIIDSEGKVLGLQEWPIDGTLRVGVTLEDFDGGPYGAVISATEGSVSRTKTIRLGGSAVNDSLGTVGFSFDPNHMFAVGADFVVRYSETLTHLDVELIFQLRDDGSINLKIKIGDRQEQDFNIVGGMTTSVVVHSHSFKIVYDWYQVQITNGNGFYVPVRLAVVDEGPLPPSPRDVIALDGVFDQIAPESWYVVVRPDGKQRIGQVVEAQAVARTDYNFPAKVTQLTLDQDWLTEQDLLLSHIRSTTVFAQSAKLELAEEPIVDQICGGTTDEIELDGLYSDLKSGRWLIVAGGRGDIVDQQENVVGGLKSAELVMLAGVRHGYRTDLPGDRTHTFITLAEKLAFCYQRDQVKIYGNVVKATHGETRHELLGNGDGSRAFQAFELKQPPVTYVAAPNPTGVDSTLHVYVDDVEWHGADTLAGRAPGDRAFLTRTDDADKTSVVFGNGQQGARLPTGAANVRAVYRNGIGSSGNVQAGQISLLASRPLGVKEVINPLRASGGANREGRDQARKNAPLAVAALDRLVSLQDYADFARSFAGIAKASAQRLSDGRRELVHLTIAGVDDIPIDPSSDLHRNLVAALRLYGDPDRPVQVDTRELLLLVMSAKVYLQADFVWEPVVTNVRNRLLEAFSFDQRELGQDALLSEAIAVMQATPGVAWVDVDIFGAIPEKTADPEARTRRLLTPNEITEFVQTMLDPNYGQQHENGGGPPPPPVWLSQLPTGRQPLDRVMVGLAGPEQGTLRPAQLAMFSSLVPDTLILNRG